MSYAPQPGDKIRRDDWERGSYIAVTAVGDAFLLGHYTQTNLMDGTTIDPEHWWGIDDWEPYVEPPTYPEAWVAVYPDHLGTPSTLPISHTMNGPNLIGVIHLHADGTLTMEQP